MEVSAAELLRLILEAADRPDIHSTILDSIFWQNRRQDIIMKMHIVGSLTSEFTLVVIDDDWQAHAKLLWNRVEGPVFYLNLNNHLDRRFRDALLRLKLGERMDRVDQSQIDLSLPAWQDTPIDPVTLKAARLND